MKPVIRDPRTGLTECVEAEAAGVFRGHVGTERP